MSTLRLQGRRRLASMLLATAWLWVAVAQATEPVEIPADLAAPDLALVADREPPVDLEIRHTEPCVGGMAAGTYPCNRVDLEAVLRAAAEAGTMVEINAQPTRLDLDWVHVRRAKALGVPVVINPDAHSTEELGLYVYGVDVARRGWLEARDVFNTKPLGQVEKALLGPR